MASFLGVAAAVSAVDAEATNLAQVNVTRRATPVALHRKRTREQQTVEGEDRL